MRVRILLVAAMLVTGAVFGFADADGHGRSIADVEQEIRQTLGVGENDPIDPDAVPEALMVELGDAVMAERVGSEARHEWMDEMMGGEGSASLDAAHRWMAYNYLAGGYAGGRGPGMMSGSMMGGSMMSGSMMGGDWGLMGNPDVDRRRYPVETPKEILDRRYASGEITRQEYRQMLEDIE